MSFAFVDLNNQTAHPDDQMYIYIYILTYTVSYVCIYN